MLAAGLCAPLLAACGADAPDGSQKTSGAVVRIETTGCQPIQVGTGMVVGDELVLTAAHVVAGADTIEITTAAGTTHAAERSVLADDVDFAYLTVPGLDVEPVALSVRAVRSISAVVLFDEGVVPVLLERAIIARTTDIYRRGEVSKLMLELDVVVDPGDSGAAVLDGTGSVIGVINSFAAGIDHTFALHRDEILEWVPTPAASADGVGSCSR